MQAPAHTDSRVTSAGLTDDRASFRASGRSEPDFVRLPASTAWPIVLAFGVTLIFGGLVTSESVTVLGGLLSAVAAVGWFRDVLPEEAYETVRIGPATAAPTVARRKVAHLDVAAELHRARLPLEIYPVSAGIKGGLAGGVVMAVLAMAYGIVSGTGIWYPINLLAAGFFPSSVETSTSQIAAFHGGALLIATSIHLITSLLVGLLYGAMLPILPRRPIVLGGLMAPIAWSGLLYSILGVVNPVMNHRIDWGWFVLSQVGFGIVAGAVVARQERVATWQHLPLALRAGIEAPGLMHEPDRGEQP
jgi:hypothetical protein